MAQRRTSELIPGQTYLVVTSFCVTRIPGWESEWSKSNTGRRNFAGTSGRGTPVDTSHTMVVFDKGSGMFVNLRDVSELRNVSSSGSDCCAAAISPKSSIEDCVVCTAFAPIRDSASAAGLSAPFTCLMSEVNCET